LRVKESLAHAVLQDEFGGNTTELQVEELKRQNEIILKDKETIRLENQMFRQLTVSQELSSKKVRTLLNFFAMLFLFFVVLCFASIVRSASAIIQTIVLHLTWLSPYPLKTTSPLPPHSYTVFPTPSLTFP
jgi:hypothetical protein